MNDTAQDDAAAVKALREAFVAADRSGDADAIIRLLAEDVVILHPDCGPISGKTAASNFLRQALTDVHSNFDKHVTHSIISLTVGGGLAYEHGRLYQELTPHGGGPPEVDRGEYVWTFAKAASGEWRIAVVSGAFNRDEPESMDRGYPPKD